MLRKYIIALLYFHFILLLLLLFNCTSNSRKLNKSDTILECNLIGLKSLIDSSTINESSRDSLILVKIAEHTIYKCKFSKDTLLLNIANSLHILGSKYLNLNTEKSRLFYQEAIKLRNDYYGDSIQIDKLRALLSIGLTYANENNYLEAMKYYDSADIRQERFNLFPFVYAQTKKGEIFIKLKNYNEAQKCLNLAFNRIVEYTDQNKYKDLIGWQIINRHVEDLITQMSDLHFSQHHRLNALNIDYNGINLIRRLVLNQDSTYQIANLLFHIGVILYDSASACNDIKTRTFLGKISTDKFAQAKQYYEIVGDTESALSCMNNIGNNYYNNKEFTQQEKILKDKVNIAQKGQSLMYNLVLLGFHISLGTCYYKQGLLDKSLGEYYKALTLIDSENIKQVKLPKIKNFYNYYNQGSLNLLISLGRVAYLLNSSKDNLFSSSACYDSLFQLINYSRANLINDQAKINLAEQAREWIPDAFKDIKELYQMNNDSFYKERAFQIVEQSKAFSLLETSRLNNASDLLPKELKEKQKEVLTYQLKATKNDSFKDVAGQKQREFLVILKEKAPSYFALKYQGVDLSIKDIQQNLLAPDQGMIEYFIQDSILNIFYISKSEFILDTIHVLKQYLKNWIQSFQNTMNPVNADGTGSQEKVKAFCSSSFSLYEVLIGKLSKEHYLPERLIIIPDGILNNLSFDALLTRISDNGDDLLLQVKNENFLVNHHTISYCFSANLLREMSREKSHNDLKPQLELFAPTFQAESDSLPFMHYQQIEIEGIKKKITNSKLDKESTKDNFIKASSKYSYLHVSTHGYVSDNPDNSFLAFSQKTATTDASQLFYLKELYNYPMNQELITLTACETALGQQREGEGNISLARGFAYAGVKSFITTLWKIETNGASKIIPGFYNHLFNMAQPKDVALTESKREFLKAGKGIYPENWAGLILIGSTNKVIISSSTNLWIFYLMGILVLSVIAWLIYKRK